MKYLKRFTDFCGGFAAVCAAIYAMGQFIMYTPADNIGTVEKVKHFFFGNYTRNFNAYVVMIALLAVSVTVGVIFERFPFVSLSVSIFPLLWIMFMLASGWLYERPMLFVGLSIVHTAGSVLYALSLDKEDGKRRAFLCVNAFGGIIGALCLVVWRKCNEMANMTFTDDEVRELSDIDAEIYEGLEGDSAKLLLIIGAIILATVLVSVLLRDLYYIDVILCSVPLVYSIKVFFTETLTVFGGLVFAASVVYFVFRVLIMLSEPMRKPKVKKECQT